ncbi:unnamed protein product [Mytilus edulis]|uniref:Uncharacterized protein n=1 Tax=Mytilus edulis TaxID=6550 RepID=A0A8S3R6S4_MYTED|nr:unnamed protein product [Mytilus edulis]
MTSYSQTSNSECNMGCGGRTSEKCGSNWRLSIYKDCSVLKPYPPNCADIYCTSRNNKWCIKCAETTYYKLIRHDCKAIKQPSIASCQTFAVSSNEKTVISNTGPSECSLQKDMYGNFQVEHFKINFNAYFNITIGYPYSKSRPNFVPEEQFGITDVDVTVHRLSVTNQSKFVIKQSVKSDPNSNHQKITLQRKVNNLESNKTYFNGWFDPYPNHGAASLASGIESYEINVYEVKESTKTTLMRDTNKVAGPYNCTKDETEVDILLPEKNIPMLYAILLEVKDRADNVRQARRFVLYDNSSEILKNKLIPLRVESASNKTNFTWQINHANICFSWKNRYFNNYYKKNNPFRPIKTEPHNAIEGIYDQISGILPVTGMNNVNGLTDFFYALIRNAGTVVGSGRVMNFTSQSICLNPSMNDGDTFLLRLQARDIMNHTLNDSIQVHIDRSVPEIADIWLIRNGKKQLYVHHSSDLSTIYLEFKAFDLHSGIRGNQMGVWYLRKQHSFDRKSNSCGRNQQFATNKAFLVAFDHIDILVDESPPEVGVVLKVQ